jgi:CheY-like chemotaxis protein
MMVPKLMVVDKDVASLGVMTEAFASLRTNVCPIHDSQRAASLLEQEQFDGVFLDVEHAGLEALELTDLVRQSSRNRLTPIVVVEGQEQDDTVYRCFCKGANFFLTRPINKADLADLISTLQHTFRANRRQYNRVALDTPVTCCVGGRRLAGSACNISQGGMQLELERVAAGEKVQLSFRLPQAPVRIEAEGVVAWAKDDRQGIHFTNMSVEHQQMVRDFITQPELSPK